MNTISIVIIVKNEEKNIETCIKSSAWANEVIVIDNNSTDKTASIAEKNGAKVFTDSFPDFSSQREMGREKALYDWIFYLDADERISEKLQNEILKVIRDNGSSEVYKIKRKNFYFEKYEWPYQAKIERLFKKEALKGWHGAIHESPVFKGKVSELSEPLTHFTHSDLSSMLDKTVEWSDTEAKMRLIADHPKMSWWRFPRVMISTFINYYIFQKGWKIGTAGLIESMYQSFSTFVTYAKLWELQNNKK